MAFFALFDSLNIIFGDAIKGAGDTKFQMMTAIAAAWLFFVPGIYMVLHVWHKPMLHAWIWGVAYVFVLAAVFFLRFRSNKWQHIKITQ